MNETVNQEQATNTQEQTQESADRTFTQSEVNNLIKERLERERSKYKDFDDLKAKAAKFDEMEEANKSELQKMSEKAQSLEAELNAMKKAAEVRSIREKVATETGVPASLLTGETQEDCKAQAEAIKDFAHPKEYPTVKDGGEIKYTNQTTSAKTAFKEWANRTLN